MTFSPLTAFLVGAAIHPTAQILFPAGWRWIGCVVLAISAAWIGYPHVATVALVQSMLWVVRDEINARLG